MRLILIGVALALAGCGGVCKERSGTYTVRYTARTGNCGSIGEVVITLPSTGGGCTGPVTISEDRCEVTSDIVCSGISQRGKLTWNADSSRGDGVFELSDGSCQGTYDVRYTKL